MQLIWDRVHILDIINTRSLDFNRQVLIYKQFKLLPGDSLLIACMYKSHPEHDMLGDLSSDENEKCTFATAFASEIISTNYTHIVGVGYPVEEGQPLKNAFLGPIPYGEDTFFLDPSWATFAPTIDEVYFKSMKDYQKNICKLVVRDLVDFPTYTSSEYNITAMLSMIIAFNFLLLFGLNTSMDKNIFHQMWWAN